MSYYQYLGDHEFTLQASQFDAVLERWRQFEKDAPPAYPSASVFYEYPEGQPVLVPKTVPEIFQQFGFEVAYDNEAMTIEGWDGKAGYENEYITAIADLVDEGWFLDWTGEDDDRWRMEADGTTSGETVFIRPDLRHRLDELTAMLDEYENATPSQDAAVLAEVRATGPIIDAIRALIEDLS